MKKLLLCLACTTTLAYPMMQTSMREFKKQPQITTTNMQKRFKGSSANVENAHEIMLQHPSLQKLKIKDFFPHGAAYFESRALSGLLINNHESQESKLAKALFNQPTETEPVKPTGHKGHPNCVLDSSVLGGLVGTIHSPTIDNNEELKDIAHEWRRKYIEYTQGKIRLTKADRQITDFITQVKEIHNNDPDFCDTMLSAFLYGKSEPTNNHHFIDFLKGYLTAVGHEGINLEELDSSKCVFTINSDNPLKYQNKFEKKYTSLWDIFATRRFFDLATDENKLKFAKTNFALATAALIEHKETSHLYPPQVLSGKHSYNNQPPTGDCMETAFREITNNVIYDNKHNVFDPLVLSSKVKVNKELNAFYEKNNSINSINTISTGKEFYDLISNKPTMQYKRGNDITGRYEVTSNNFEDNVIAYFNHFFGVQAKSLSDIGTALSSDTRDITFTMPSHTVPTYINLIRKQAQQLVIEIKDKDSACNKKIFFNCIPDGSGNNVLTPGHGWVNTENKTPGTNILNQSLLLAEYNKDPKSKALLGLSNDLSIDFNTIKDTIDPSLHYLLPKNNDDQKGTIINNIISHSAHDKESANYACTLFQRIQSPKNKIKLIPDMIKSGFTESQLIINQELLNQEINDILANNFSMVLKELDSQDVDLCMKRIKHDELKEMLNASSQNNDFFNPLNTHVLKYSNNHSHLQMLLAEGLKRDILYDVYSTVSDFEQGLHERKKLFFDCLLPLQDTPGSQLKLEELGKMLLPEEKEAYLPNFK